MSCFGWMAYGKACAVAIRRRGAAESAVICLGESGRVAVQLAEVNGALRRVGAHDRPPRGRRSPGGVDGATCVGVVPLAADVRCEFSSRWRPWSRLSPHDDLAAGVVRLRTGFGGRDDSPHAVRLEVERAHVVVVVGLSWPADDPLGAGPSGGGPGARIVLRTRLVAVAGQDKDHRPVVGVEDGCP